MLNDFLITRDAIGYLQNYVDEIALDNAGYRDKLRGFAQKQQMSYEQWWQLLEDLSELTGNANVGVDVGRHVKVEHCGVLGYLFRTSRNLLEALTCFKRFERLLYAGSSVHTEQRTPTTLSLVWDPEFGYSSQLSDELLLTAMINITREILQPHAMSPLAVEFTQIISDRSKQEYESFFRANVSGGNEKLALTFALDDLLHPIPHKDPTLHSLLGRQAEELLKQLPDSDVFLVELRDAIIRCLHEGRPNAESVAEQMHISARTLHRRLQEKHRIFRDVLKDIRKSMAIRYLLDDKLVLAEIALLLGYAEQSAFTRAFTQWFGQSPLQYKRQQLR